MKIKELREKSEEELKKLLAEKRADLVNLRFNIKANQQKNYKLLEATKKDVAKILTLLKNK